MLDTITVKFPLLNEDWQMPLYLKESLYEFVFADLARFNKGIYEQWFQALSLEDQQKIRKVRLGKPY